MDKRKPFRLGQLLITPGAFQALANVGQTPLDPIIRHFDGDWGDVCREDWEANDLALVEGTRLLSAYTLSTGVKIWVITEADRSATTILLPSEY